MLSGRCQEEFTHPVDKDLIEIQASSGDWCGFLDMEDGHRKVQKKPVRVIAAVCKERGIGKNGTLPWNLPSEFQYFLRSVTQVSKPGKFNMLVWGKLCWFSNPQTMFPMANVLNAVLSETLATVPDYAHFLCQDLKSAVLMAAQYPLADLIETIWVVGGTRVYKDALDHPWCDLVFLTDIMAEFECDVFFPEMDPQVFKKQERFAGVPSGIHEENGIKYQFQVFKRNDAHRRNEENVLNDN
ncbi:dihydrofolate reductase [Hippocampus comes]|uniref:dihydrofolate reductase n=1 Tax=Hippocampus comes TaxID=109280 RepID=A0A3Q2XNI4_HIPCM|nr:PREDICTED: dihydrofolate reductase-like [Hippocampus comes]